MSFSNSNKKSPVGYLSKIFGRGPVKPGESYGAPGVGNSLGISIFTSIALIFLWWLITSMGWIKPLFLPSPESVLIKFVEIWNEEFSGATLLDHTKASLFRVFGAFFLACITAIPIGIAMGVNRIFRGIFDPPIEFYRPIPPLGYLPLTIIWLGIEDTHKIKLIYLAVFAPMSMNARYGVLSVAI
jgi:taurine transport system permease protein